MVTAAGKPGSERPSGSPPRAFVVLDGALRLGYLGEGSGPFITAAHSALPNLPITCARFTSLDFAGESRVAPVLETAESFDAIVEALEHAGLTLTAVPYGTVFVAPERVPRQRAVDRPTPSGRRRP